MRRNKAKLSRIIIRKLRTIYSQHSQLSGECECSKSGRESEREHHMNLDHVTIRTRDLQATRDFFLTVFGLQEGERPLAIRRIPGHWLYFEGRPLIHIIGSQGYGVGRPAEAID